MCIPQNFGGLGFRSMKGVNLALAWKLLNNLDSLWVKHLHSKYIRYGSFLSSPNPPSASWIWKGIMKTKPLISSGACLQVYVESNLPIWSTPWIPTLISFKPAPKFPNNRNLPSLLISDLIDPINLQWNKSSLFSLFDLPTIK